MKLITSLCVCAAMALSLCGNATAEVFVLSRQIQIPANPESLDRFTRDGAFIARQDISGYITGICN